MGIINYYAPPVPYSGTQLATINNLVSNAFRIGPANSVHQARMPQPIGYNVPDVELQTATFRIQLGLRMLHARDLEGQTLRSSRRALQLCGCGHNLPAAGPPVHSDGFNPLPRSAVAGMLLGTRPDPHHAGLGP